MHSHVRRRKTVVFFAPDVSDVSTIKRAEAFIAYGYRLVVLGFRRDNYNRGFQPAWPFVSLGRTKDNRYAQRITALLKAALKVVTERREFRDAEIFYARNIDQLMLALLARLLGNRTAQVVYEVLDIQPAFVGQSWVSRLLRFAERFGLRRTNLLVVSSPGFVRHYFRPIQGYEGPWFLLENKLSSDFPLATGTRPASDTPVPLHSRYRWVVGYCGLIRGQETIDMIIRIAERLQGLVLFRFRGIFTTADRDNLLRATVRLDNLVYEGDYVNPRDLADIYGDLDFAWAVDLEHRDHNSRWLLPCRFYEAGYFGVPCLAAHGFEVGRLIDRDRLGWTFDDPYEDAIVQFFKTLPQAEYDEIRQRLLSMPNSAFVAGEDTVELMRQIDAGEVSDRYRQMAAE